MKMSQGVEWALHCTVALSFLEPGDAGSRHRLAEYFGLPDAYLAKQLNALVRARVLSATTGPQGGYRLARPADEITTLDVVEAIEGSGPAFICAEIRQQGICATPPSECRRPCAIARVMYDAEGAWRESLDGVTISDLARKVPRRYQVSGRTWLSRGVPSRAP